MPNRKPKFESQKFKINRVQTGLNNDLNRNRLKPKTKNLDQELRECYFRVYSTLLLKIKTYDI